jgi:hypothetical protein
VHKSNTGSSRSLATATVTAAADGNPQPQGLASEQSTLNSHVQPLAGNACRGTPTFLQGTTVLKHYIRHRC